MDAVLLSYLPAALIGLFLLVSLCGAIVAVAKARQAVREEPGLPAVLLLLAAAVWIALAYGPRG